MPIIYHVTTRAEWNNALVNSEYKAPSLNTEGFIHCSEEHQVTGVLERYFTGMNGLVKLVIDTDKLKSRYVQEWSPSTKDTFPHVYGPINVDAVTTVIELS